MPTWYKHYPDLGLFLIRIGLAAVFIVHGWGKLSSIEGTIAFFATIGLPAFFAWLIGALEFVGGVLLLLGLWVELSGWVLAAIMLFAIILVKGSKGFAGGYEFELSLLFSALGIALTGGGKITLQKYLKKNAQ